MSAKRIFILDGHPAASSLSRTFAQAYADAARKAGHDVRLTHIHDLEFDADYGFAGYARHKPLEPGLEAFLADLEWAEHVVLATPMWWGGLPAKLKGLVDRAFLPGRVFDTRETVAGLPKPMMGGRSARVFLTSDTPRWYFRLFYHNALMWQLRRQILGFIGLKPTRITHFPGASHPDAAAVPRWLAKVEQFGAQAA